MDRLSWFLRWICITLLVIAGLDFSASAYAQEQNIVESFGLYSKGIEYYRANRLQEAQDVLNKAVQLDPRNDEAKVYLDIVNAEIKLRVRLELESYERQMGYEPEYEYSEGYPVSDIESEPSVYCPDKIKNMMDRVNTEISPGRIKGEYKAGLGITGEDVIWKDANGDYNERNFRMIDHNFPKTNTYDKRVYDRLKVVVDTNSKDTGLNLHSDITVDPWSFVGKTEKFTIPSVWWGDSADIELKYWSGTGGTINETYYSSVSGNSFSLPELEVEDGEVTPIGLDGLNTNESGLKDAFIIPRKKIYFTFQPIRELWMDFNSEDYKFRFFPYALEDQALSSDDPLGISNHHIYWEPSPWLDEWKPGHINTGATPDDFWRGEWSDDLSFFTRDSDLQRLTALRGFAFKGTPIYNTDLSFTVATPKTLWQDYGSMNALPGAIRTKTDVTDWLMFGAIDTFRIGYNDDNKVDSYNNVIGMDVSYDVTSTMNLVGEVNVSNSEYDKTSSIYKRDMNGTAGHIAFKKDIPSSGYMKLAVTHMDEDFDPGLSNYRETRRDQFWSRHIYFKKPLEEFRVTGAVLKYEDIEAFKIGDGIDIGRDVLNFRLNTKELIWGQMDNLLDYRYVRDSEHKYVEGVFREENTFRIVPTLTSKILAIYHSLPKTKAGIDPIQYDSDTGEFLKNTAIEEGKDPSVWTYAFGMEYVPEEWISFFGIYENTNDFRFGTGNYPNGLLNSSYFTTETIEGEIYRKEVTQLYSQGYFDLPPYERFNIYKAGISLKPSEFLGIQVDYTKNDFKFAGGIDDNINHFGTTVEYKITPKLTGFLKHTFSMCYNLYRLNTSGDLKYENHNNVFLEFDYKVSDYGLFRIQFGEGAVISPVWGVTASPFGDFYPTLDTQHIVRMYYEGRF